MSRHPGYIFKTVRADKDDYWEKFVTELVEPEEPKHRFEKRMERDRLPYTIRLNPKTKKYEVVETESVKKKLGHKKSNPLYPSAEKMSVSKHQSTSYANPSKGFKPSYFGWGKASRNELLVGVSFNPDDCLFWLMMLYDGGTHGRQKDFQTRETAQAYLDKQLTGGIFCESLEQLEIAGRKNPKKYNEVLAGLKWNMGGSSAVVVFSDNLESRLLAQLRALDLKKRLAAKYPDKKPITVPISIYPDVTDSSQTDFMPYDDDQQKKDRDEAKSDPDALCYVEAIDFVHAGTITENKSPAHLLQTYILLEKLGKKHAKDYLLKINCNDFYFLMGAFHHAICRDSSESVDQLMTLISDMCLDYPNILCSAATGPDAGENGFYFLILALFHAALKNSSENVKKIVDVVLKLIEKCDPAALAALIAGLSSSPAAAGPDAGKNGFYFLIVALFHAVLKNSPESVEKIVNVVLKLIEKCDPAALAALIAGLSLSSAAGPNAGKNGFYFLMGALSYAASKNSSENVKKIVDVVLKLIEK
ncbi:MAG: hypothetical protein COX72_08790, partial [Gammaproteobacteria bacterium CG_4_10_14_0_2_um_filter_38_22]